MNKEDTLKQICKMISSGDIPKVVYDKYLSKTQLGFMNYEELYDFLNEQNKKYKEVFDKIKKAIDECWYMDSKNVADQVFLKKCELKDILKEVE